MIHGKKRNKDLFRRLTESWGYTKPGEATPLDEQMAEEVEDVVEAKEEDELDEGVFDANHYCIHHGGVHHNGSIEMAEAVQHVKPDANGHISHYDMKLEDGTILENVAAEDIQVTNASLAKEHQMKRDHDAMKDKDEDEELDEGGAAHKKDPRNRRQDDERARPMEEAEELEAEAEELEEMDMSRYTQSDSIDSHEVAQKLETLTGKVIDDDIVKNMLRTYGAGGPDALEQFSSTVESITGKAIDFDVLRNMLDHGTGVKIRERQEQNEGLEEAIRRVVSRVLSEIKPTK